MQTEFWNGRALIQGTVENPRAAQRREAKREISRQEAVAARFADAELVAERNKFREAERRRVELLAKAENLQLKITATRADLAKAERLKAAAEDRLRSLLEAERDLAEMTASTPDVAATPEPEQPQPVEKRGPSRPRKTDSK